jgi:anti-sigma factor RsiW
MTFNPDDPKWTAYVLGELEDAERAEVESLLESSEEARAYVEELRVATGALEHELRELKVELAASLTDAQRAAIQTAAGADNIRWFRQPQAWFGGLAVAAMILIAIAIPSVWKAQKSNGTEDKLRSVCKRCENRGEHFAFAGGYSGNCLETGRHERDCEIE